MAISAADRVDDAGIPRAGPGTKRPRKLLYVITDLRVGGAEAMLARLATAAPALADEIIVASLLAGGPHGERLRTGGVRVVELGFDSALGLSTGLFRLAKLVAQVRPDIVQGWMYHGDLAALLGLALSGRGRSTRLAWSLRCSDLDFSRYSLQLRLVVKACAWLSRGPDVITANSEAGLKAHLHLGYRPRRSEIILNGIDTERFRPDAAARAAVRSEFGLAADAVVVAHVARVDPMKDHAAFLAAMTELPDLHAMLIGLGTERLPDRPNLLRLGRRDDVPRLLAAADFIASSSAFGEGFSNALAEGMACALPAVATDVGDARAIIGDTGMIVPARDAGALAAALRALANEHDELRAARGQRARRRIVKNFTLAQARERFAVLYASIMDGADAGKSSIDRVISNM